MVADDPLEITGFGHPILIGDRLLERSGDLIASWAPAHRYAIVTDSHVGPLYAGRVLEALQATGGAADIFTFTAGEAHKTRETWSVLTDELLSTGFGRDSSIVALGGGVVGDLAGFVAATFMRGIPVVQVPTTLSAMVDASLGGKTGVDTPAGKNLVGAFHFPAGVMADPQVLATLQLREFSAGMAEVLKHGAIADESYFYSVAAELPGLLSVDHGGAGSLRAVIARSIEIKVEVVRSDTREGGIRRILNFGHTVGHALEAVTGYALLHGEAVAIGMVTEAAAGELAGVTGRGTADALRKALAAAGLPVAPPPGVTGEQVMEAARTDKKKRQGSLEFAVPERLGIMAGADRGWTVRLPESALLEVLG